MMPPLRWRWLRGLGRRSGRSAKSAWILTCGLWALLLGLALDVSLAVAAEAAPRPAGAAAPLRYRKVFVPSESLRNLESSALRDEAFVPIRREEFDQLLGAVGSKLSAPQAAASPQIVQAAYEARLEGELLSGTGRLTVVQRAESTAVLSLEPCNLVISEPRWQPGKKADVSPDAARPPAAPASPAAAEAKTAARPSAAQVAVAEVPAVELGCNDAGQMVALVDASGVLQFHWSRRGEKNAAGHWEFDLRLPNAAVNQLRLTLPAAVQPQADGALVSPVPDSGGTGAERVWLVEVRGNARLSLRLAPASGAPGAQPLTLLRQEHRYVCGLEAAEVAVRLRLDVHQAPLSEVTAALDEPLQLYRAYYRDSPLTWTESKSAKERQITLALPEPLLGDGHEIRLQAIAPAEFGTAWRLPRAVVRGVACLEGVTRLEVPEPLWLAHLETVGCRQVQAAPLLAPQSGQTLEIRDFQPRPQVVAHLQRRIGQSVAQTLTRVKLGTAATNLEYHAQLTCSGPPRYGLALDLQPGWTVDLVQTQPPESLEEWQVTFRGPQSRSIEIRFREPVPADRPVQLTMYAHRRGVRPGDRLRDLRLGTLRDVTTTRGLIAIAADAAHQVALSGDAQLKRLAVEALSSWEKEHLQAAVGAITFLDGDTAEDVNVALLGDMPSYSAEIDIEATYSEKWVEQTFRVRCQPTASTVSRLVVRFSEPLAAPLRWMLSGEEGSVQARALGGDAEATGEPRAGSDSWEILLPRPRGDPFELVATRSDAFSGTAAVPLVSLPAAASQVGYVTLRSSALPLAIQPRNVRPIPAEPPPPGRFSTTRGAFRYDPSLDCRLSVHSAEGLPGSAWVRSCNLSTTVLGEGRALHTAVCQVENRGQLQVLIVPPADAELVELLVSGRPFFRPREAATLAGVMVNLPGGEREPILVVRYTTRCSRTVAWATVVAPWPNLGMPVFERHWSLHLPPGWAVESPGVSAPPEWTTRLFGPVIRTPLQPRFEPWSGHAWTSLLGLATSPDRSMRVSDPSRSARVSDPAGTADRRSPGSAETSGRPGGSVGRPGTAPAGGREVRPLAAPASPPATADLDLPNPGWTATQIPISAGLDPEPAAFRQTCVRVVQRDFFRAASWAALLATAGLMAWATRRRPVWCLPLTALWGCLALLCPATWVPIASGCFLGSLLSVLVVWLLPPAARRNVPDSAAESPCVASTTTAVAVLLLVLLLASVAVAQSAPAQATPTPPASAPPASAQPAPAPPVSAPAAPAAPATPAAVPSPSSPPASLASPPDAEPDKIYRVLFPVDAQQQPAEPYVYVPRDFWNRLRRAASGEGSAVQQWLIAGAEYRVVFDRDAAEAAPLARELVAVYRVRTRRAGVRLVLPIRQNQVYLLPNRARLDGRPASVAWEADGTRLVIEIPEAGEADLELAFRPQVERSDGMSRCEVLIPRVPDAQLHLQLPNDVRDVVCPTAVGAAGTDAAGERLFALGPADRLVLQWPSEPASGAAPAPVEGELLMWLKVRPGGVVLQAKVRFQSSAGRLPEVGVLASEQLRLLGHPSPDLIPLVSAPAGEDQRIRWQLKPPLKQEVKLDLEFLLTGTSGIGAVRIPRLEVLADRTTRRWLGISVDEALRYEAPAEGRGEAVDAAAFAAAWERGTVPPQLAVSVPEGTPAWSLTTQPQEVKLKAAQQLNVAWSAERADVQFEAQLESSGAGVFEYRVNVPEGLEVGGVSVRGPEVAPATLWSRLDKKTLAVRLERPIFKTHQLQLRAALSIPRGGEFTLAGISVAGAEVVADSIALYRRPSASVSVLDRAGLADVPAAPLGQYRDGWGRLVALLQPPPSPSPAKPLHLSVAPNRPRTQGTLVTVLDRAQDAWRVQLQYDLQVDSGVVDAVRWEVPADWSGPFACDCPGDLESVAVPDQKRRHLLFRPQQPITASRRLCITGKLATPQGGAVQAPDVMPLDVDAARRYLCAPTQIKEQGIAWKTSGLRETAGLPAGFEPPTGPHKTYLATQPRYQATIEDVQPSSGQAHVELADLEVTCAADGEVAGTATFDLQPSGAASCELELPEGCQLVHVAVADLPAMLESLGSQRWRVTLGPRQLPQQIQVVYQGRWTAPPSPAAPATIQPPRLVGIPVQRTLWTVRTADSAALELLPPQDRAAPATLEFVRFATRAALIEQACEALAAADPAIAARWYSAWHRRLAASRRTIDQWSAANPEVRSRYARQLQDVKTRQAKLDEKLKSLPNLPPAGSELSAPDSSPPQATADAEAGSTSAAIVTGDAAIQVGFRTVPDASRQQCRAAAAVLLALAALAWFLLPHPVFQRGGNLLLSALGVGLGVVWWYWCTPSTLGLAMALVSLLVALRRWLPWRSPADVASPTQTGTSVG